MSTDAATMPTTDEKHAAPGPRVRIAISACLLGQPVRYDGGHRHQSWCTDELVRYAELVPLCPEMAIGLGAPRPTLQLQRSDVDAAIQAVMPATGRDVSTALRDYADAFVLQWGEQIDGVILKARSPSCGVATTPLWQAGDAVPVARVNGLFADQLVRGLPGLPVIDEEELMRPSCREAFLQRVYAYAKRVR